MATLAGVDDRLLPLNAFISLCTPDHLWPSPLAGVGYRISGLEVPVASGGGRVVVDAVAFREDANRLLAAEAKSGNNVDGDQARRYVSLDADETVRAASITLTATPDRSIQGVYVCFAESADRISMGLEGAAAQLPILAVSRDQIVHRGTAFSDANVQAEFDSPVETSGYPPRYITVDPESSAQELEDLVRAALVQEMSHSHPQVSVEVLAQHAIPYLSMYGAKARGRLVEMVDAAARRICESDPDSFVYGRRTERRPYSVVEFRRQPEEADRRGRTQMYQAVARAAGRRPRPRREIEGQEMLLFEEFIEELESTPELSEDDDGVDE